MPKYLITGGCGFIGSHLAEALVNKGEQVVIYDNLSSGFLKNIASIKNQVTFIQADIRDQDALQNAIKGVDGVFHQAALVSVFDSINRPQENHDINITGTFNVLKASVAAKVKRVVLASSAAVYGNEPTLPKVETQKPQPESPYALGKLAGEYYAQLFGKLYGLSTVCLRYFNVYGPRQDPSSPYSGVISRFVKVFAKKDTITIFGDGFQTRDFVFVKDVVQANLAAMQSDQVKHFQLFNVGSAKQVSLVDLINVLKDLFGYSCELVHKPARDGDIKYSVSDISAIQNSLNYKPLFSLAEGLLEYKNGLNELGD